MSSSKQAIPGQYSFASKEPRLLRAKADKLIAVFLPDGLLNAIVNEEGESIFIHYHTAPDAHKWSSSFFEEKLSTELYSKNTSVKKKVFVASDKQMVVPEEVYQQEQATALFGKIYFKDVDETIGHYACKGDKAQLLANINLAAQDAAQRCLGDVELMPVNYAHFYTVPKNKGILISCIVTNNQAYCTLRSKEGLVWHQVFSYETVEDILFQLMHVLRELNISKEEIQIQLGALHPGVQNVIAGISAFFAGNLIDLADEKIAAEWLPVTIFIQQLSKCG